MMKNGFLIREKSFVNVVNISQFLPTAEIKPDTESKSDVK
jgi:hypothetical protein